MPDVSNNSLNSDQTFSTMSIGNLPFPAPTPTPISLASNPLQNIRHFRDQWKCYCYATGLDKLTEETKGAVLNLVMGQEALRCIETQLVLTDEDRTHTDRILAALEHYFKPTFNITFERYQFNQAVQEEHEKIDDFIQRLRKLATNCGFEKMEEHIRDRAVVGIRDPMIKNDLIADPELTLQKVVDFCRRMESNDRELSSLYKKMNNHSQPDDMLSDIQIKVEKQDSSQNDYASNDVRSHPDFDSLPPPPKAIKIENSISLKTVENHRPSSSSSAPERRPEPEKKEGPVIIQKLPASPEFEIGSFVVAKSDLSGNEEPPIWKIDSASLLQKFVPFKQDNVLLYKSTAVYSGWSMNSQSQYNKVPVMIRNRNLNQKEFIVQLKQELVRVPSSRSRKKKD